MATDLWLMEASSRMGVDGPWGSGSGIIQEIVDAALGELVEEMVTQQSPKSSMK